MGAEKGIIITHSSPASMMGIHHTVPLVKQLFSVVHGQHYKWVSPTACPHYSLCLFIMKKGWTKFWNEIRSSRMETVDLVLYMIGFRWRNLVQCRSCLLCNKLENRQINMIRPKNEIVLRKGGRNNGSLSVECMLHTFYYSKNHKKKYHGCHKYIKNVFKIDKNR